MQPTGSWDELFGANQTWDVHVATSDTPGNGGLPSVLPHNRVGAGVEEMEPCVTCSNHRHEQARSRAYALPSCSHPAYSPSPLPHSQRVRRTTCAIFMQPCSRR